MVGAAGQGKSTFCRGMKEFLELSGRKTQIINLDPANHHLLYECAVDVASSGVVDYEKLVRDENFGPNGALIECMRLLASRTAVLSDLITKIPDWEAQYFLVDTPGQAELISNYEYLPKILTSLEELLQFKIVVLNLQDVTRCYEPTVFVSTVLEYIKCMLHFERFPLLSVLSKIDLLVGGSELPMRLSFYAECRELHHLNCDMFLSQKLSRLNNAILDLIDDWSTISLIPIAIQDRHCMKFLLLMADRAGGFASAALSFNDSLLEIISTITPSLDFDKYLEYCEDTYCCRK